MCPHMESGSGFQLSGHWKPWDCPLAVPLKQLWAPGQRSLAAGLGGSECPMESVPAKLGASRFPLWRAGQQTGKVPGLFQ